MTTNASFQPASSAPVEFTIGGWRCVPGVAAIEFDFVCPRFGAFRERVEFPLPGVDWSQALTPELADIVTLLHCALGTSYYKLTAAPRVAVRSGVVSASGRDVVRRIYNEGMAEFRFRNGLPQRPAVEAVFRDPEAAAEAADPAISAVAASVEETFPTTRGARTADSPMSAVGRDTEEAFPTIGGAGTAGSSVSAAGRHTGEAFLTTGDTGAAGPPASATVPPEIRARLGDPRAVVAFGGGKDSFVAQDLVRRAGISHRLVSVALSGGVADTLRTIAADFELDVVTRTLDPALREATAQVGYSGHVPVTAINSLCLAVYAALLGARMVIFANERSADEPTILGSDPPVNHQYSKSYDFEKPLHDELLRITRGGLEYFSLLRAVSELWIARYLSRLPAAMERFTSCNRNFAMLRTSQKKWCGECAKCAFTFLILAPFNDRAELERIFGSNPLARPDHAALYEQILGLGEHKPWDCVGSVDEARAALWAVSEQPEWADLPVVRRYREGGDSSLWGLGWPGQFLLENLGNTPSRFHGLLEDGLLHDDG